LDIQSATRRELENRQGQVQREKKEIEAAIQNSEASEQRSIETGDGRAAFASRKAAESQRQELEVLAIEEKPIIKRLQEFDEKKPEAEGLKAEIEQLYNRTASEYVRKVVRAQKEIVQNLKELEAINSRIGDLANQYRELCGESLYAPTIAIPGLLRQLVRGVTARGPGGESLGLQPAEPFSYVRRGENEECVGRHAIPCSSFQSSPKGRDRPFRGR
jgi:hypothetical protein